MRYTIRALDIKSRQEGMSEFARIGSTLPGQKIMVDKIFPLALKVKGVRPAAINILKQEMLARNGDVVTSRDMLLQKEGTADIIIEGTYKSFAGLIEKLKLQPFGLKGLSAELRDFIKAHRKKQQGIRFTIGGRKFRTGSLPLVMGILNITPDSFYDGGRYIKREDAEAGIKKMVDEGADIIDVGGMSTRPGSKPVSVEQEWDRVIPLIEFISKNYGVLISVDTYRSQVAAGAVRAGAHIINDISALTMDPGMAQVASSTGASVVLMHMQGTPENMQEDPRYEDVVDEIYGFLLHRAELASGSGISEDKIIIDPGIGFGKTPEHNLIILNKIREFSYMGYPVLVGASRKSFLGKLPGLDAGERLEGSLAAAVWSAVNGVNILRVHDVAETVRAVRTADSIISTYR